MNKGTENKEEKEEEKEEGEEKEGEEKAPVSMWHKSTDRLAKGSLSNNADI